MNKNLKKHKIVEVVWLDHYEPSTGWRDSPPENIHLIECKTVGYIMKEDKETLFMCMTVSDQEHMAGGWGIGKKLIVSRSDRK